MCGHPKIVQAFADVKDNSDSGQFMAIQQAAARGPASTPEIGDRMREKYRRRLQKLVDGAEARSASSAKMPGGTYFLYAQAPKACGDRTFANAEEASQYLIHEQSVCCVPWDDAGPYLRFSVTYIAKDEAEEDALMAETERAWAGWRCVFEGEIRQSRPSEMALQSRPDGPENRPTA